MGWRVVTRRFRPELLIFLLQSSLHVYTTSPLTNCTYVPSSRIQGKEGLHVMAARLAQPTTGLPSWTQLQGLQAPAAHHLP